MADTLVVIGAGGHAKVVIEAALASDPSRQIVIVDDGPDARNRTILGFQVSGDRTWLETNLPSSPVALGIGENSARLAVFEWLEAGGWPLETIVHPSAVIGATAAIGDGSFLAAGSIVIADTRVGRAVIVNTSASVDHDCEIGDAAHIGPGAHLCGAVRVGARTLIGVGSAVCPGVSIGSDVIVGAGSSVVCDLADGGRFAGSPARPIV